MASNKVQDGVVVSVEYVLKLEDGEIVEETTAGDPLVYLHGANNIIPGLEDALTGMALDERKHVVVQPEDAYGDYDPDDIEVVERSMFGADTELEVDDLVTLEDEDGEEYEAIVADVTGNEVTLDFNHPLAGETLHFDLKIVGLREATPDELSHGHPHLPGHVH